MARFVLAIIATSFGMLVAIPVVLVGLPFWVVGRLTRTVHRLIEPRVVRWPELFEYDSQIGWKAKANLDCYCLEPRDDVFHIKTDAHGWPGTADLAESNVVVFGDSHAWGYGVDHKSSFLHVHSKLPIKAIAAPGYNMVQELLLMERLASQLKDKLIVWFVYVGNDLHDNLCPETDGYTTPFVKQLHGNGKWEIVTHHLRPMKWTSSSSSLSGYRYTKVPDLYSETFSAERAFSACNFLIEKGSQVCQRARSRLVVMSIPAPFALSRPQIARTKASRADLKFVDPNLPDRRLATICSTCGIEFVPLQRYLDIGDFKARDDHWTKRGHRRVAEVLWNLYRDYFPD